MRFWNMQTRQTAGTILRLRQQPQLIDAIIAPTGHVKSFGPTDDLLIHIVETEKGDMFALSPKEFTAKYGWRNNPTTVKIEMPEPKAAK